MKKPSKKSRDAERLEKIWPYTRVIDDGHYADDDGVLIVVSRQFDLPDDLNFMAKFGSTRTEWWLTKESATQLAQAILGAFE